MAASPLRLLFLGDVFGRPGRRAVAERLPELRRRWALDAVVVNGENAAGGAGITEAICAELLDAGADVVTLGNHSFDQREALVFIEREPRLLRPVNLAGAVPGRGATAFEARNGARVLVVNAIGRLFMGLYDDPFRAVERELEACPLGAGCDAAVIDFHAEATSEKMALAHHLDGRASLVVGTHTHAPTADHQVLAGGTAYLSDAGMCGDYDSVIGMDKHEPVRRFLTSTPGPRYEPAEGEATLCGLAVEVGADGLALRLAPVRLGGRLERAVPAWWEPAG